MKHQNSTGKSRNDFKNSSTKQDFFDGVYKIVAEIPYGKVTTYGDIAEVCGLRSSNSIFIKSQFLS